MGLKKQVLTLVYCLSVTDAEKLDPSSPKFWYEFENEHQTRWPLTESFHQHPPSECCVRVPRLNCVQMWSPKHESLMWPGTHSVNVCSYAAQEYVRIRSFIRLGDVQRCERRTLQWERVPQGCLVEPPCSCEKKGVNFASHSQMDLSTER